MLDSGESPKEVIRLDVKWAIMIDFQGAQVSSDTGFILLREIDECFRVIGPMGDCLENLRSTARTKQSLVQMVVKGFTEWPPVMKLVTMPIFFV